MGHRYFQVDGPAGADLRAAVESSPLHLPTSYKEFVLTFGNARLYKQHAGYGLGVCPTADRSQDAASPSVYGRRGGVRAPGARCPAVSVSHFGPRDFRASAYYGA